MKSRENILPRLVLKAGKERSVLRRHPWVFSGAVAKKPDAAAGDCIVVADASGKILGRGFYDPSSQIICRLFDFGVEETLPGPDLWTGKLHNALSLRKAVTNPETTSGFRLLHAEGDHFPGVIADIYGNTASLQLRVKGVFPLKDILVDFLSEHMQIEHIFVSEAGEGKEKESTAWVKGGKAEAEFLENGLKFSANIEGGQKTGYFLDQRENRALVKKYAAGKTVADLFSYAGGFSVHALAGGAKSVTSVDSSASAQAQALRNVQLNFDSSAFHTEQADCFDFLKQMQPEQFDLIVLDPPAFTKHISTVEKAARGYKEINMKAIRKIAAGGLLFTYSCSQHISPDLFRKIVFGAAADAGRRVRILHFLSQAPDHPIDIYHPEGEYLKGLALRVD